MLNVINVSALAVVCNESADCTIIALIEFTEKIVRWLMTEQNKRRTRSLLRSRTEKTCRSVLMHLLIK